MTFVLRFKLRIPKTENCVRSSERQIVMFLASPPVVPPQPLPSRRRRLSCWAAESVAVIGCSQRRSNPVDGPERSRARKERLRRSWPCRLQRRRMLASAGTLKLEALG